MPQNKKNKNQPRKKETRDAKDTTPGGKITMGEIAKISVNPHTPQSDKPRSEKDSKKTDTGSKLKEQIKQKEKT